MKQFWALSIYDMDTRNYLRSGSSKPAEISSNDQGLKKNADGSVDLYFGPRAPKGWENNWLQTLPGKFWFPYFRLYAPTEAYFDKSWPLPDLEKANPEGLSHFAGCTHRDCVELGVLDVLPAIDALLRARSRDIGT